MRSTDYITVPGWAITELKLSGNELLLYSLIHGYTRTSLDLDKDGNEIEVKFWFSRPLDYVAEVLGVSKNTACTVMGKLHEKGLLEKETTKKGVLTLCKYRTKALTLTITEPNNSDGSRLKTQPDAVQETCTSRTNNLYGTVQETCMASHTNNLDHITHTIINTNNSTRHVINTNNIINKPSAKQKGGLLKESPSLGNKKEDKLKSWINARTRLLQRYNFPTKVHDEVLKFFQMLTETNTLLPHTSMETQLDELAKLSEQKQYDAVHSTISRGWKSLSYAVQSAQEVKRPYFDTATKSVPQLKDPKNDRRFEKYIGQELF